jgi:hypothetical protein
MTDKFLSLEADKQRVFSMRVERFETGSGERPVVVTAERGRIAVFCGRADGSWINFIRPHDLLNRLPRRPEHSHFYGWSRDIGVASGRGRIVLAYRRRFTTGDDQPETTNRVELWIDVIAFDEATEQLSGSTPVAVPRLALDPAQSSARIRG